MFKEYAGPRTATEQRNYKSHMERVKNPKKKIDNDPPKLDVEVLFNPEKLRTDPAALGVIESRNRELLKKINIIYRTKGKIDNKEADYEYSSNYQTRKKENQMIENSNKILYKKIITKPPTMDARAVQIEYFKARRLFLGDAGKDPNKKPLKTTEDWSITPLDTVIKPQALKRVKCFFDIEAKHLRKDDIIRLGRIHIEVYRDYAPIAGENFIRLCRGDNNLSYKGTIMHKVFKGVMCLGGDVDMRNGLGGKSAFGFPIPNEDPILDFNGPGVFGTFTPEQGKNTSQFLITFRDIKTLKKYFVAFGKVTYGHALNIIEEYGTKNGVPLMEIRIKNCGILSPESEKKRRFGEPKIPQELIDLNEKIKNEEDRERRERLDFEVRQQFYKKYGFLTKLDPTIPYPPFPWKLPKIEEQDDQQQPEENPTLIQSEQNPLQQSSKQT